MNKWIETKVRYDKVFEEGITKKVTESYLVSALSFTEAEARITRELASTLPVEFEVCSVKKNKVSEVFYGEGKWYNAKLSLITLDEKTGCEKKSNINVLAQAESFVKAVDAVTSGMKGTVSDWEFSSVSESPILEIFR